MSRVTYLFPIYILVFLFQILHKSATSSPLLYCPPTGASIWAPRDQRACHTACTGNTEKISIKLPIQAIQLVPTHDKATICRCRGVAYEKSCEVSFWGTSDVSSKSHLFDVGEDECRSLCDQNNIYERTVGSTVQIGNPPDAICSWWDSYSQKTTVVILANLHTPIAFQLSSSGTESMHSYITLIDPLIACPYVNYTTCAPLPGTRFVWKAPPEEFPYDLNILFQDECIVSVNPKSGDSDALQLQSLEVTCPNEKSSFRVEGRVELESRGVDPDFTYLKTYSGIYLGIRKDSIQSLWERFKSESLVRDLTATTNLGQVNYALRSLVDSANRVNAVHCRRLCDLEAAMYRHSRFLHLPSIVYRRNHIMKLSPSRGGWCLTTCLKIAKWKVLREENGLLNVEYEMPSSHKNITGTGWIDSSSLELMLAEAPCSAKNGVSLPAGNDSVIEVWNGMNHTLIPNLNSTYWNFDSVQFSNIVPLVMDHSEEYHDVSYWYDISPVLTQPPRDILNPVDPYFNPVTKHHNRFKTASFSQIWSSIESMYYKYELLLWAVIIVILLGCIGFFLCQCGSFISYAAPSVRYIRAPQ